MKAQSKLINKNKPIKVNDTTASKKYTRIQIAA
jgi:hypothetical protein